MRIVEPLLGTRAELQVTADDAVAAASAESQIIDEVRRLESVFTVFDAASALNDYRRTGQTSVPELIEVVTLADEWHHRSGGAFDPRLHPLIELWDQGEAAGKPPSAAALAAAVSQRDTAGADFDNLNAIAKGWIAQAALTIVDTDGDAVVDGAWLSLGGDVVHRGSGTVTVGIEDPHRPYDNAVPLARIEISNEAVATSGGARRWWTIGGRRYPKVLDPRSGLPAEHVASATIVAPDAAVADVLATIATVAETDLTLDLAQAAGAVCLLVHPDRSRTVSSDRFEFG